MTEGQFTLVDFLAAMKQMKRMGSMKSLRRLIPGMGQMGSANQMGAMDADQDVNRVQAMIQSMTHDERQTPDSIDASRRLRIARGSGTKPDDVNDLLQQFMGMSRMMERMDGMSARELLHEVQNLSRDRLRWRE